LRIQLTNIERLDKQFPGLELDVCLMLDADAELASILKMLAEKYKVEVPLSTLSNYKQRRYLPERQYWKELIKQKEATLQIVKKHGTDALAEAAILEQLDEARRRGECAPIKDLLRESRERQRLRLEREELEIEKDRLEVAKKDAETRARELEFKLQQLQVQRAREAKEVKHALEEEAKDPDALRKRIDEIYGIIPEPQGDIAAVPSQMGG
jgi:hypothetical protein